MSEKAFKTPPKSSENLFLKIALNDFQTFGSKERDTKKCKKTHNDRIIYITIILPVFIL